METALHAIWTSVPQAAAIWITMLLVVAIAGAAVTLPGHRTTIGAAARRPGRSRPARRFAGSRSAAGARRVIADADETVDIAQLAEAATGQLADDEARYAEEIAEVAARAAATAERCRSVWVQAQDEVGAAWTAYDEADNAARRTAAAAAFPVMSRRRPKGENADRERYLHHAATEACRNRELSIAQLNDALAHRGWDARKHPVQQEAALRNAVREHRFAAYRSATAREQETWQAAEQAAAALRSLRAEALSAKIRAGRDVRSAGAQWWAEQWQSTQPLPVAAA